MKKKHIIKNTTSSNKGFTLYEAAFAIFLLLIISGASALFITLIRWLWMSV